MTAAPAATAPAHPATTASAWWAGGVADHISLPAGPITVGVVRHFVRQTTATWRVPGDITDDLVLIASELATNAITHTGATTYDVTLTRRTHSIELAVTHAGGPSLVRPLAAGAEDESGRGLAILAHLATAWGSYRHADGTRTWARLHLPGAEPHRR